METTAHLKLKAWIDLMREMSIIENQAALRDTLIGRNGKNVSNAYISNMVRGLTAIPDKHLKSICSQYYFTPIGYFLTDQEDIVNFQDLLSYIADHQEVLKKDLVNMDHVKIASYKTSTDDDKWQEVFDMINEKYGYRLDVKLIRSKNFLFGGNATSSFEGKSKQVKYLHRIYEIMHEKGLVDNRREFAINILECNPNQMYNMKLPNIAQDVTKDMIVNMAKNVKNVNLRYLLLGEGEPFIITDNKFQVLQAQINELKLSLLPE